MTYKLKFIPKAFKEWSKLGHTVREQLKNKLKERLQNPHVPSASLTGDNNLYKIKLRSSGYRLVYSVKDKTVTVLVLAVGKRDRNETYQNAMDRNKHLQ